jgi:hypothetical protein
MRVYHALLRQSIGNYRDSCVVPLHGGDLGELLSIQGNRERDGRGQEDPTPYILQETGTEFLYGLGLPQIDHGLEIDPFVTLPQAVL